jgi:adenylyltransferase/sulfurtransferase
MIYDALAMADRAIDIRKDPQAPTITGLVDYEAFCGAVSEPPVAADASITPGELRDLMDSGAAIALIDVREPVEWEINRISGARLIPKSAIDSGEGLAGLPQDAIPVLYCKTGIRSAHVLATLHRAGFANAVHLQGGIVAWAAQLEPDMAMY